MNRRLFCLRPGSLIASSRLLISTVPVRGATCGAAAVGVSATASILSGASNTVASCDSIAAGLLRREQVRCCAATGDGGGGASGGGYQGDPSHASHVAKSVNKLKRAHQTASAADRKRLELEAWAGLNSLTDDAINSAEGQSVALLLNAWAYFARFWEKGKEGPNLDAADHRLQKE